MYGYLQLIHVAQQQPTQRCKGIILQLKMKNNFFKGLKNKNGRRSQIFALQRHQAKLFKLYLENDEESFKIFKQAGILMSLHFRKSTLSAVSEKDWKCGLIPRKPPKTVLLQQAVVPVSFPSQQLSQEQTARLSPGPQSGFYCCLNLVSTSASFPKWPSPKSPMTFTGAVCHCLFDLLEASTQLTSPICLKPISFVFFFPFRRMFLSND